MVEMISEGKGVKHVVSLIKEQGLKELSIILDKFEEDLHPLGYGNFMDALAYVVENDIEFCKDLDSKISKFMDSRESIIENVFKKDDCYEDESECHDKCEEETSFILNEHSLSYLKYRLLAGYNNGDELANEGLDEICTLCNLSKRDKLSGLPVMRQHVVSKDGSEKTLGYNYLEGVTYVWEGENHLNKEAFLHRSKDKKTSFAFTGDVNVYFGFYDLFSEDVLNEIKETFVTITEIGCKVRAKVTVCDYILEELILRITAFAKELSCSYTK